MQQIHKHEYEWNARANVILQLQRVDVVQVVKQTQFINNTNIHVHLQTVAFNSRLEETEEIIIGAELDVEVEIELGVELEELEGSLEENRTPL
jgi:hypothetical protein